MSGSNTIKENVVSWIDTNSDIRSLKLKMKELNEKKKVLEINILEQMKNNNIDTLSMSDGNVIKKKCTKRAKSFSEKNLMFLISEEVNEDSLNKLYKKLESSREFVEKEFLSQK